MTSAAAATTPTPSRSTDRLQKARQHLAAWELEKARAALKGRIPSARAEEREVLLARLAYMRSDYSAVITRMRPVVGANPMNFEARVLLGRAFIAVGQKSQAVPILDAMADYWNDGRVSGGPQLMWLAVGLQLTEYFKNASQIFGDAVKASPDLHQARIRWAYLFIEKYNFRDSDVLFDEVLKTSPGHPQAIVGKAVIDVLSDRKLIVARERLKTVLEKSPRNVRAHTLWALIDIHHERYADAASRLTQHALKVAPNDLEALTLLAAAHYVADDTANYRKVESKVRRINPRYARFYSEVSQHAARVHRYKDAIALNEQALRLDPQHWRAMANLGMGYSRIGNDLKARDFLDKSFEGDPFDTRTYNLLEFFYDKVIKQFQWIAAGPMKVRAHKTERDIIERYVPPLLQEAYRFLTKKYRFTPKAPLHIEIFHDPQLFAIRSIGLPNLGAHGICFGHVITARSPSAGNFNWAEVLWHELSHVFHIQLSDSRVPRWFTEGLAVYESTEARKEWRREMDPDLLAYLDAKKLRGVGEFNLSFTQAKSFKDILVAYYHAYMVTDYIVAAYGNDKVRALLKAWGERKTTAQAFRSVLGLSLAAFDAKLFAWLHKKLAYLRQDFRLDVAHYGADAKRWIGAAKKNPKDAQAQAFAALAWVAQGKFDDALKWVERALAIDAKQPHALLLRAKWRLRQDKVEDAKRDLETLLAAGVDGTSIRASLARVALKSKDRRGVVKHLTRAVALNPKDAKLYHQLIEALDAVGDEASAYTWRKKALAIDQMNIRLIGALLEGAERFKASQKEVLYWGEFGNHIAPFSVEHHIAYARELKRLGLTQEAAFEAESALMIAPSNKEARALATPP